MSHLITIDPGPRVFSCADGQTLLDAALDARIGVPFSCRVGKCGSCRATVLAGAYETQDRTGGGVVLLCRTVPLTDMQLEAPVCQYVEPSPVQRLPARVVAIRWIAEEIAILTLRLPPSQPFRYLSGQSLALVMQDGSRKYFSLARPHDESNTLELHIRRVPGGRFTDVQLTDARVGERVHIEGPFGSFGYASEPGRAIVLVAGGTGFAPIQALLMSMAMEGLRNPIHLYWGMCAGRHFYAEPEANEKLGSLKVVKVVSDPDPQWSGRQGLVHEAVLSDFADLSAVDAYVCGVPPLVEAARRAFVHERQLDPQRFFADAFGPTT